MTRRNTTSRLMLVAASTVAILSTLCVLFPASTAAAPVENLADVQARAASVRREVARLDQRAAVATEEYNSVRAELDTLNIRLQESRRALARVEGELESAQYLLGERLSAMYKSDGYGVFDVLLGAHDFSELGTQLGYFRSINEADQNVVTRVEAAAAEIDTLTSQIDRDRATALEKEIVLREKQADIEDELAERRALLAALDATVKKLLAAQERLEKAAARRLAREAGVDLRTIAGTPVQIAVIKETMKYMGISYVWGGATPSGGFDCSGLVLYVYAKFGVQFPHGATMQAYMGDPVPLSKAQPADLVFFGNPSFYHHVGIYVGNGLFIEAPHTGDVVKVSRLAGRGCSLVCRYRIHQR